MVPTNLTECFNSLRSLLSQDDLDFFINTNEDDACTMSHHNVGRYIRNTWNLWTDSELKQYFVSLNIHHPDDMSAIILHSFCRILHNKPIELENKIQFYIDYWKKNEKDQITN